MRRVPKNDTAGLAALRPAQGAHEPVADKIDGKEPGRAERLGRVSSVSSFGVI
jgi:hypothetical protein